MNTDDAYGGMRLIKTVSVFGMTESELVEQLVQFKQLFPRLKLGLKSNFLEIDVKLFAPNLNITNLEDSAAEAIRWIRRKLGSHVFSDTGQSMEQVVGKLLLEKNATLAVAESCTGGLIANMLTDVPGSSEYFLLSAVTYANLAKINILNINADTLAKSGAVSEQTVAEMAHGAKKIVDATYGLATSGIAGPGGGSDDKPVGTVCIGLATPFSTIGYRFIFADYNRLANKRTFALAALDLLRKELLDARQTTTKTRRPAE